MLLFRRFGLLLSMLLRLRGLGFLVFRFGLCLRGFSFLLVSCLGMVVLSLILPRIGGSSGSEN